jgi:hypothetical protein
MVRGRRVSQYFPESLCERAFASLEGGQGLLRVDGEGVARAQCPFPGIHHLFKQRGCLVTLACFPVNDGEVHPPHLGIGVVGSCGLLLGVQDLFE